MTPRGGYERGFADGRREGARLLLDTAADDAVTLAGRLGQFPAAAAAVNEAAAIIRDAAKLLAHDAGGPRQQAEGEKPRRARAGGSAEVERRREGSPGHVGQEAPE